MSDHPSPTLAPSDDAIWAPAVGFPGYFVSDEGHVLSVKGGHPRVLRANRRPNGYLAVTPYCAGKPRNGAEVHVLVTTAFHGPRPSGLLVRHLDGNRLNNRATNLCWGTGTENQFDAVMHGANRESTKTHCKNGHPFDDVNTRRYFRRDGRVQRVCRQCEKDRPRNRQRDVKA